MGLLIACTRPNPAVCCLDAADCSEVGIAEVRGCAAGLACVDHECVVPSCSRMGCEAMAPVCNITTDICEGCTSSTDCERFANICDTTTGACVECVGAVDCPADRPICEANACRACKLDTDCASGACGDDGACVAEAAIVYLDAGGVDSGTCTKSAPCRTFAFAVPQTSTTRNHLVLAYGGYVGAVNITGQSTTARPLFIHGGGASLSLAAAQETALLSLVDIPVTIRHLELFAAGGNKGLEVSGASSTLEDIKVHNGYYGIVTNGALTMRDILIESSNYGLLVGGGSLELDRAVISGRVTSVYSDYPVTVMISNLLAWGTAARAIELPTALGSISFTTVANSGTDSGTGPRAVSCGYQLTVRSSIIWAPGSTPRPAIQGCNLVSSIVGPTPVPGAMNLDPQFVDGLNHDYHLAPSSPARDAVDTGPTDDFERDARPRGTRFDIGADEAGP